MDEFSTLSVMGGLLVHDNKLREFETNNTIINKSTMNDSAYKERLINNLIQEMYGRTEAIHQLKNARAVEEEMDAPIHISDEQESINRDRDLFKEIDTVHTQANTLEHLNNLMLNDRVHFMKVLDTVQYQMGKTEIKMKQDYNYQFRLYLIFYILGTAFIAIDKGIKLYKG